MLFVEFAEVVGGWLCCNGRIDNMNEVKLDRFGKLVERVRDKMESIADGGGCIVWCG
jgi:hypothetical protein